MMVIGRGHTVYFENRGMEYGGESYQAPYKVTVNVKGEQAAKLYDKERGMTTWLGQNFKMDLVVVQEKGGAENAYSVALKLPYSVDGIIVNLPALLAGLPQDAWFSEFVPTPSAEEDEEEVNPDEFSGDDFGAGLGTEDLGM